MLSRLSVLASRPRHTLAALAVVLAAVGVAVGSGANFTAQVASAGNTFSSGTLTMAGGGTAILGATNMKPGDQRTGLADIENTGSVSGTFGVHSANATGDVDLLGILDLRIRDCGTWISGTPPTCDLGDTEVYSGPVDGLPASQDLGLWQPAEKHRYQFIVDMKPSVDDTFQGKTAELDFVWTATT